ncbi:hypothetical protein MAR_035396 [Mya arenaria]|uniref:Uncharacterized protein n=1 Tax=Mya arenaria TaxID=6604 RepID=A0ABY7EKB5_MYAAR|nr:hypothetical protein MAR_035396 [Mya arenaria]
MDLKCWCSVFCCMSLLLSKTDGNCARYLNIGEAKIPKGMDLATYKNTTVGTLLGEVYFGMKAPPLFVPDVNYHSLTVPVNSTHFAQLTEGDTPGTGRCASAVTYLKITTDETRFQRGPMGSAEIQVYFSSCPTKYVWGFRCSQPGGSKQNKCPLDQTYLGLYVVQNNFSVVPGIREYMSDLPFEQMAKDLCPTAACTQANNLREYKGNINDYLIN